MSLVMEAIQSAANLREHILEIWLAIRRCFTGQVQLTTINRRCCNAGRTSPKVDSIYNIKVLARNVVESSITSAFSITCSWQHCVLMPGGADAMTDDSSRTDSGQLICP